MKTLLLITWFVAGKPVEMQRVEFPNYEKCYSAKNELLREHEKTVRTWNDSEYIYDHSGQLVGIRNNGSPPRVTAICVKQ